MPATGAAVMAFAGSAGGASALTSGILGLGGMLAGKLLGPKPPSAPPAPPPLQQPDGSAAASAVAARAKGVAGLSSTNLTGPQGLTDPATTAPKTLLGG